MSEWISVEDKLPEYDTPVLVTENKYSEVWAAMLVYEDGWMWAAFTGFGALTDKHNYEVDDDYQYSYWQPIPAPPTKEQPDE